MDPGAQHIGSRLLMCKEVRLHCATQRRNTPSSTGPCRTAAPTKQPFSAKEVKPLTSNTGKGTTEIRNACMAAEDSVIGILHARQTIRPFTPLLRLLAAADRSPPQINQALRTRTGESRSIRLRRSRNLRSVAAGDMCDRMVPAQFTSSSWRAQKICAEHHSGNAASPCQYCTNSQEICRETQQHATCPRRTDSENDPEAHNSAPGVILKVALYGCLCRNPGHG